MIILDLSNNKALKNVNLYLTLEEAKEMLDDLDRLIANYGNNEHSHINDSEYEHEVTLTLYSEDNLQGFDERSKALIKEGI